MNYDYLNSNAVRLSVYVSLAFLTAISTDVSAGHFTAATLVAGLTAGAIAYNAFRTQPKPDAEAPPPAPPNSQLLP